jgi:hypothetical protein
MNSLLLKILVKVQKTSNNICFKLNFFDKTSDFQEVLLLLNYYNYRNPGNSELSCTIISNKMIITRNQNGAEKAILSGQCDVIRGHKRWEEFSHDRGERRQGAILAGLNSL